MEFFKRLCPVEEEEDGQPPTYQLNPALTAEQIARIQRVALDNYPRAHIGHAANRRARATAQIAALLTPPGSSSAASVSELIGRVRGVLDVTADGTRVLDETRLRTETVHYLAREASLSRHPEAAVKFRELLQLGTPWT